MNNFKEMVDNVENNVVHTCKSVDYSLLVVPKEGFRLYGSFAFQLIYGRANVNGHECAGKKLSPRNLMCVSAPASGVALHVTPFGASVGHLLNKAELNASLDSLASRLRSLVDNSSAILALVSKAAFADIPVAVIVIKHEMDVASRFIAQQHTEPIFKAPQKAVSKNIGRSCFLVFNNTSGFQKSYVPLQSYQFHSLYQPSEMSVITGILGRVDQVGKRGMPNRVMVVGKKNVGKSTLMCYLANQLLNVRKVSSDDDSPFWMKRIFLLDCDVGQSELSPPGVISLNEITEPFFGAAFSRQISTLCNAYFFGAPSPSVNFALYKRLVKRAFDDYLRISGSKGKESVLLINTLGWIEDLGYDLLLDLLKMLTPTLLVNLRIEGALSFQVPTNYRPITVNFLREINSDASAAPSPHFMKPAVLRAFSTAGYLAQCFRVFGTSPTTECVGLISRYASQLRLADLPAYRVRFASVGIYLHPEMPPIDDHLILSALNCAIVGLCEEVEINDSVVGGGSVFKRRRLLDNDHFPMRLTLNKAAIFQSNCSNDNNNNGSRNTWQLMSEEDHQPLPLLRCYGHAMIRAIDPDQKLFYLLTPVDVSVLKERVNVLAVGHELQATSVLFDGKGREPAPYLVEFERRVTASQRKMLSPLTNVKPFRLGYGKKRQTSNGVQKTAVGKHHFS